MGGCDFRAVVGKIVGGQISYIAVARQLAPRPAFHVDLVDVNALAKQRLRIHARFRVGFRPQRYRFRAHAHAPWRDIARRRHDALQAYRGKVRARRRQAPVEGFVFGHYFLTALRFLSP